MCKGGIWSLQIIASNSFPSGLDIGHKYIVAVGGWQRGGKVVLILEFFVKVMIIWTLKLYLTFYLTQGSHCGPTYFGFVDRASAKGSRV